MTCAGLLGLFFFPSQSEIRAVSSNLLLVRHMRTHSEVNIPLQYDSNGHKWGRIPAFCSIVFSKVAKSLLKIFDVTEKSKFRKSEASFSFGSVATLKLRLFQCAMEKSGMQVAMHVSGKADHTIRQIPCFPETRSVAPSDAVV